MSWPHTDSILPATHLSFKAQAAESSGQNVNAETWDLDMCAERGVSFGSQTKGSVAGNRYKRR